MTTIFPLTAAALVASSLAAMGNDRKSARNDFWHFFALPIYDIAAFAERLPAPAVYMLGKRKWKVLLTKSGYAPIAAKKNERPK